MQPDADYAGCIHPTRRAFPQCRRRRLPFVLALRLLPLLLLFSSHLGTATPPDTAWHTLGRLLLATRAFPLLAAPLAFQLSPALTLPLQAATVAAAAARVGPACASPRLQAPGARASMQA